MLTQERGPDTVDVALADGLGPRLAELASRLRADVLVEAASGVVVGHATHSEDVPPAYATAVLRRSAALLARSVVGRRSIALLPGGPLLAASLPDWPGQVLAAPLAPGGQRVGWLWLLTGPEGLPLEAVTKAVAEAAAAAPLIHGGAAEDAVLAALEGRAPLPASLVHDMAQVWVAAVRDLQGCATADELRLALRMQDLAGGSLLTRAAHVDGTTYVVVLAPTEMQPLRLAQLLTGRVQAAEQALGRPVAAAVSAPAAPDGVLTTARGQADSVLSVRSEPGLCTPLHEARSDVVLHSCAAMISQLSDLGPDPFAWLLESDAGRGNELARTLLTWLDLHGDVRATADQLRIHPNTLRYRLRRVRAATGGQLDDPAGRLELHLRLRALQRRPRDAVPVSA